MVISLIPEAYEQWHYCIRVIYRQVLPSAYIDVE